MPRLFGGCSVPCGAHSSGCFWMLLGASAMRTSPPNIIGGATTTMTTTTTTTPAASAAAAAAAAAATAVALLVTGLAGVEIRRRWARSRLLHERKEHERKKKQERQKHEQRRNDSVRVRVGGATRFILSTSGRATSARRYRALLQEILGLDVCYLPISSPDGRVDPQKFVWCVPRRARPCCHVEDHAQVSRCGQFRPLTHPYHVLPCGHSPPALLPIPPPPSPGSLYFCE